MNAEKREFLRHTLATLAYRGGKSVSNAPEGFDQFRAGETARTPAEILAHIGDLLDWAAGLAKGEYVFHESTPLPEVRTTSRLRSSPGELVLSSPQSVLSSTERGAARVDAAL